VGKRRVEELKPLLDTEAQGKWVKNKQGKFESGFWCSAGQHSDADKETLFL
jgi:hypothetical protein